MHKNLLLSSLLGMLTFCIPSLNGQNYQFFSNPTQINIPDKGPGNIYPSLITVSGQNPFLQDLKVHFESAQHQNGFADVDILLEAPNGQKVVLCSNAGDGVEFMFDLWFGNSNLPLFTYEAAIIANQTEFRPTSFELLNDTFPAPGPGILTQHSPSLHTFDGINPNGIWKLWVVGDTENGATGSLGYNNILGDFGWELAISSSANPVCARPGLPEVVLVEDTFAVISWPIHGNTTNWDLYYAIEPGAAPDAFTPPSMENVGQFNSLSIPNLVPDRKYSLWVRSDCNGAVSDWIGPLDFHTKVYPCKSPVVATMCEPFDMFAITPFYNWMPDACTGLSLTTPKRMIQFTPPVSGLYNITGLGGLATGHAAYKAIGSCDTIGWTCWDATSVPGYEFAIDLEAGLTYWLYFEGMWSNLVKINACPINLPPGSDAKLEPIAVSPERGQFRWYQSGSGNQPVPGAWDILYQPASNPNPGFLTQASELNLQTDNQGFFQMQENLVPGTDYQLFIRLNCGDIWTCWSNPLAFSTPVLTSTAADITLDSSWEVGAIRSFLSWENTPASASDISWEVSWGFSPFDAPQPENVNVYVDTRVSTQLDNLSPSRNYDLWLRPRFPSNVIPLPYWIQEWQGPFPFETPDYCGLITDEIFCMEEIKVGFISGTQHIFEHLDLEPTACAPDASKSGWETVLKFRAPISGPVNIVPTDVIGTPGRQCLVFYKKASKGCWAASGWENIGCWEMGTTPPILSFNAEKDTLYYLAFDTRKLGTDFIVDDFGFRLEACPAACPTIQGLTCVNTEETTAEIRWNSLGPGKTYTLEYFGLDTVQWASFSGLTDTSFTFMDLSPTQEYVVQIFHQCNGNSVLSEAIRLRTGANHPNLGRSFMSGCNPQYHRPGAPGDRFYFYDVFEVDVPVAGQYTLEVKKSECLTQSLNNGPFFVSVYENSFDPANPMSNLLGFTDSLAMTATPTQFSLAMEPSKNYLCVISPVEALYSPLFTPIEDYCVRYEVRGPGYASLTRPVFQGKDATLHGQLEATALFDPFPDYACADTAGWLHYYRRGSDENRYDDDYILLSRENYGADGATYIANGGGALQLFSPPANYVNNASGWFVLDRYWDVETPTYAQPTAPVLVRFYFTEAEFQVLRDSVMAAGGTPPGQVEQLYFYKINDYFNRYNPDPKAGHVGIPAASSNSSDGYWEYKNGPIATDSTWRHEPFLNGHMAETMVRRFSGGGGGIGGNLQGATTWVRAPAERPQLHIFPNPTQGWLTMEGLDNYPGATMQISDILGRILIHPQTIDSNLIDIRPLPPGNYFLSLNLKGKMYTWQIMKQ